MTQDILDFNFLVVLLVFVGVVWVLVRGNDTTRRKGRNNTRSRHDSWSDWGDGGGDGGGGGD